MRLVPLTGREDRAALLAIAQQDMRAGYRPVLEAELEGIGRGSHCGVWAVEGTAIGYALYHRTVQTYHLDTIAVDRPYRRLGIGRALLGWICADLRRAARRGVLNVVTEASAHDALAFYLDRGFIVAGRVTSELIPGVTHVHLTREFP